MEIISSLDNKYDFGYVNSEIDIKIQIRNGSITLFLSLIILIVISLVLTSVENARISSAYTRGNEISYMALDSCFSSYAKEVFDEYGLMMLWKGDNEIINVYNEFSEKNSNYKNDSNIMVADLLSLEYMGAQIIGEKTVRDNGELIGNQIYDYMKLAVPKDAIENILGIGESLSQSDSVSEFSEKMDECTDSLSEVENCVEGIYKNVEKVKDAENNPKDVLSEMKKQLEEIKAIPSDGDKKNERDKVFELYKAGYDKYIEWESIVGDALTQILVNTNDYLVSTLEAERDVNEVDAELKINKDKLTHEVFEALSGEIDDVRAQILSLDEDNYNVMENKEMTMAQKKIVNNVIKDMETVKAGMTEFDNSKKKLSEYDTDGMFTEMMYERILKAVDDIEGYDITGLFVEYEPKSEEKKENEIVNFVNKIKKDGVLGYVVEDDLSTKKIGDMTGFPSKETLSLSSAKWEKYDTAQKSIRKALIGQYIFDKFHSYTDTYQTESVEYEIEYIVAGKSSDKENLEEVVNKIIAIREGFNLTYLLKDSKKREEAYVMAAAITGFTGMPVVIRITQFLIMTAWAYAESVVDVKDLLAGYKVSIIKKSSEWNLSLNGIKTLSSNDQEKEKRTGLSYEDYLRFFLFNEDEAIQVYRILDMIQLNMNHKYNKNFKIADCILEVEIAADYEVKRIFSELVFIKNVIADKREKFYFEVTKKYGY